MLLSLVVVRTIEIAHLARLFVSLSYDSSSNKFDIEEEDNMSMLLALRNKKLKISGSVFGRRKLWREGIEGHYKLMRVFFNENPTYPESYFRQCFRMSIDLFKHIAKEVMKHDQYFEQRRNST
jgi:hypothetical protein